MGELHEVGSVERAKLDDVECGIVSFVLTERARNPEIGIISMVFLFD